MLLLPAKAMGCRHGRRIAIHIHRGLRAAEELIERQAGGRAADLRLPQLAIAAAQLGGALQVAPLHEGTVLLGVEDHAEAEVALLGKLRVGSLGRGVAQRLQQVLASAAHSRGALNMQALAGGLCQLPKPLLEEANLAFESFRIRKRSFGEPERQVEVALLLLLAH